MDGTVSRIKQIIKLPNKVVRVLVEGLDRGQIYSILEKEPHLVGEVEIFVSVGMPESEEEQEAMRRVARETIERYTKTNTKFSGDAKKSLLNISDIGELLDQMAFNLLSSLENKQLLLGEVNVGERFTRLISMLNAEMEVLKLKNDINAQVKQRIDQNQKEYYLREQLKVIQGELGDQLEIDEELLEYEERGKKLKAKKAVKDRIQKEIKRLKRMSATSSESSVVRNYIENLLELPWNKKSKDNLDINEAQRILDEDHYGLEKVKDRVIEHLAVRQIVSSPDSPIICLVGSTGYRKDFHCKVCCQIS